MDEELRASQLSGEPLHYGIQLARVGRLEECADTLEKAWLEGNVPCGDVLFHFLDEWRVNCANAVATRLDRLACAGNDRARAAWETWFPDLALIVGISANVQGLRRVVLEHATRPLDVLILKGAEGVGKSTAARALHRLTSGSEFCEWDYLDASPPPPPMNGTLYVGALEPGAWEARCVHDCRERRTRLVVGYPFEDWPQWQTLHTLGHVDYAITPLDWRREDVPALIVERFPEWLLYDRDPDFERIKTIKVEPEAIAELSKRSWPLNARGVFYALYAAAMRALRSSQDPETLTIGVRHLRPQPGA